MNKKEISVLNKADVKLETVKKEVCNKRRMPKEEQDKYKEILNTLASTISGILEDESISIEVREELERETRKQIVLINKMVDKLMDVVHIAKDVYKD